MHDPDQRPGDVRRYQSAGRRGPSHGRSRLGAEDDHHRRRWPIRLPSGVPWLQQCAGRCQHQFMGHDRLLWHRLWHHPRRLVRRTRDRQRRVATDPIRDGQGSRHGHQDERADRRGIRRPRILMPDLRAISIDYGRHRRISHRPDSDRRRHAHPILCRGGFRGGVLAGTLIIRSLARRDGHPRPEAASGALCRADRNRPRRDHSRTDRRRHRRGAQRISERDYRRPGSLLPGPT